MFFKRIVVTLLVLIYEVRGAKNATLQANAQERQRRRDDLARSVAESSDLAGIQEAANQHLGGSSFTELAAEFGLEPDQFMRLTAHYGRASLQLRNAYLSGLPEEELESLDQQISTLFALPAYAKWYDLYQSMSPRVGALGRYLDHVDEIRASMQTT